ncbi:DUF1330 domain-containing protein [Parasedimentitalea maritima]|uniref:DUF1330 domain-containing protein n=1 Tax=Parasedimentitalea maritima TaxID=2578117 RepID=UPI001BB14BA0
MNIAGYVLHHYNNIDGSRVGELGPLSLPIVEKYGDELLVSCRIEPLKGNSIHSNMVVYKFETFVAVSEFYHSPEMVEFSNLRDKIKDGLATVTTRSLRDRVCCEFRLLSDLVEVF